MPKTVVEKLRGMYDSWTKLESSNQILDEEVSPKWDNRRDIEQALGNIYRDTVKQHPGKYLLDMEEKIDLHKSVSNENAKEIWGILNLTSIYLR